ncbi:HAD family phosphatase [Candidatus Falkowbacteria bacterium]|nr:HAD family phosphatase [Candidatus Falkowbacteria bacterium]
MQQFACKAIGFDLDGTLVDTERMHYEIYKHAMRKHGKDLPFEVYRQMCGMSGLDGAKFLIQHFKLDFDPQEFDPLKDYDSGEIFNNSRIEPMLFADTVLAGCAQDDVPFYVVTSSPFDVAIKKLNKARLTGFVGNRLVTPSMGLRSKPHPDMYLKAVELLKIEPNELYAIEDSALGVASAISAGCYCVAVPSMYTQQQDFSGAYHTFRDIREAVSHFHRSSPR